MDVTLRDKLQSLAAQGRRVGVVAQGGGMRGVYSMAALAELQREGMGDVFTHASGASSGAINLAYFLGGQADDAVSVYTETISNRRFINPWRFWRIVDIDFLVDVALKAEVPVDVDRVRASSTNLLIDVFDAERGELRSFDVSKSDVDLFELFRATAALPALYNKTVSIDGRLYVDGGTQGGVPVRSLIERDCELIVAILTRAPSFRRLGHGRAYQTVAQLMARGMPKPARDTLGRADPVFNESMSLIEAGVRTGSVVAISPSNLDRLVGRTTFDPSKLRGCVAMARDDVRTVLDQRYVGPV